MVFMEYMISVGLKKLVRTPIIPKLSPSYRPPGLLGKMSFFFYIVKAPWSGCIQSPIAQLVKCVNRNALGVFKALVFSSISKLFRGGNSCRCFCEELVKLPYHASKKCWYFFIFWSFGNIGFWRKAECHLAGARGVRIVALSISSHKETQ